MNNTSNEHKLVLQGHLINYVQKGKGIPIIFLHNGGGFWQSWIKQIDYFGNNYQVFGIDWPGFGESSELKEPLTLELLTNVLTEFIQIKELKNVILIGNCIGGSAALNFTLKFPEKVRKLLIFNICPGMDIYRNTFASKFIERMSQYPRMKKVLGELLADIFTKTFVKRNFPAVLFSNKINSDDYLFQKYLDKIKEKKQTNSRVNMVFSVHTFTLDRFLDANKFPKVDLYWGSANKVTPLKSHGMWHKKLLNPNCFEIIQNGSHLCMYEQPDLVNSLIEIKLNEI